MGSATNETRTAGCAKALHNRPVGIYPFYARDVAGQIVSKPIKSDPNDFAALETFAGPFQAKNRTNSAAFLIWFLQTIYRLDDVEADDSVCDRTQDEGFDAIVVNDQRREIILFQCKRREKLPATLGDTDLKQFVGSLANFKSQDSVEHLIKTTTNPELVKLLKNTGAAEKRGAGYRIRPIFVSNVSADKNALKYLPQAAGAGHNIELWDLKRLGPVLKQLSRDWFIEEQSKLRTAPDRLFVLGSKTEPKLIYAAVKARELAKLPGIDDLRLFAQNVRLGLGNTRVNSEIVDSLQNKKEHPNFIAFHNGLTIVARKLSIRGGTITLKDFSVCNGCQSLLSIWENRKRLTDELEILVRIVRVGTDRRLPELIAYRTNNQNSISLRDLSSNDSAQVHLKNSFDELFSSFSTYGIKRGESTEAPELSNEHAGRLLLALYIGEPWSAHQKYRIFGDLETQIFNYDVRAEHIRLAQLVDESVNRAAQRLNYERLAKYGLTHFLLVYLVGQILQTSPDGRQLLKDPLPFLSTNTWHNPKQDKAIQGVDEIARYVVTELNYFIKESGEETYDYKTSFKSQADVHSIRNTVQKAFEKDIAVGRAKAFSLPK